MNLLGDDFRKARDHWLYPQARLQGLWRGLGLAVAGFLSVQLLQVIFSIAVAVALALPRLGTMSSDKLVASLRADVVFVMLASTFPAAVIAFWLMRRFAKHGLPNKGGLLPFQKVSLGVGGWALLSAGFLFFVLAMFALVQVLTGFDPMQNEGLVERTMRSLSIERWKFLLIIPGVVIGAPLFEETVFRGFLFAALAKSPLGWVGAVVISSGLWAMAHAGAAPWSIVGCLFLMGLVLGVILLRFGSLWVTMVLHGVWNLLVSLQLFMMGGAG